LRSLSLLPSPGPQISDLQYVSGVAGHPVVPRVGAGGAAGADAAPAAAVPAAPAVNLTVQGLSLIKPPYGTISAIDLNKGEILWQIPHGETPDAVRNSLALKGVNVPRTGQTGTVGTLITKTLVIAGDPQATTSTAGEETAVLHAYDKVTGAEVGAIRIPTAQSGSPMTYMLNGKQYIVVAVSSGTYSGEYLVLTLPGPSR